MELNNEFRVGVPVSDAWKVLTDVERIAPMLPGAQLQEVEGDEYRGIVKVKVGPITAQYKGSATFLERDEAAGRMVLKASGRDTRGQGNASATITVSMAPDGEGTKVDVDTDLTITGKVAQFGRGVLAEVSAKLMGQFVDALEADLAASGTSGSSGSAGGSSPSGGSPSGRGAPSQGGPSEGAASGTSSAAAAGSAPTATEETGAAGSMSNGTGPSVTGSGPRRIDAPEAEPVDLLAVAGSSTAKRLVPVVLVALVLAVLLRRRKR